MFEMKRKVFILSFLVIGLMVFGSDIRADNEGWPWAIGGYFMSQPPGYPFGLWSREYSPYWYQPHHPYYYPYLRHYPYQESSPYTDLEIRQAGELLIMVNPSQAEVYVDGYLLKSEEGSFYRLGLLIGRHRVEVKAEKYKPYFEEAEVKTGQKTFLNIQLEEERK